MIILRRLGTAIVEDAIGDRNGLNKSFSCTNRFRDDTLNVIYNGQVLYKDIDFNVDGVDNFSLIYIAPYEEDVLKINYYKK